MVLERVMEPCSCGGREEKHGLALVQKERSPNTRRDLRCMCLGPERDEFPFTGYVI